ncbi:MAG: RHS repeat-associated core domain-containing protein [Cellulosilyticaceae bacterium]
MTLPNGNSLVNRYDAEGLHAEIEENNRLTKFIFHQDRILAELDAEDNTKARLVTGHGVVAANINGMDNSYYYHQDEQGSTAIITDENADIKNSYHYDAFGKILESQETLPNRITYTGQQYDPLTQQYYLRARYYNPIIGRFTQEDIYRGDGLNLYAYCSNNPVSYYDPSGYAQEASPPCKAPAVTDADGGDTKRVTKAEPFINGMNVEETARYKEYWYNKYAQNYANVVNTNRPWKWRNIPGGGVLQQQIR